MKLQLYLRSNMSFSYFITAPSRSTLFLIPRETGISSDPRGSNYIRVYVNIVWAASHSTRFIGHRLETVYRETKEVFGAALILYYSKIVENGDPSIAYRSESKFLGCTGDREKIFASFSWQRQSHRYFRPVCNDRARCYHAAVSFHMSFAVDSTE